MGSVDKECKEYTVESLLMGTQATGKQTNKQTNKHLASGGDFCWLMESLLHQSNHHAPHPLPGAEKILIEYVFAA